MARRARRVVPDERHLLVVFPHPDDETFACAGVIALLRQRGVPVTCVCATRGQMGRNMGRPPLASRESLPALREQELRAALRALDVDDLRLLGFWDKTLEFVDPDALAAPVEAVLREVRPSLVITFHPDHGAHPDHEALGAATVRAVRRLPPAERPRVWCPAVDADAPGAPDLPLVAVDIRPVSHLKRAAFAAHRSQTEGLEARTARDRHLRRRLGRLFEEERFWVYPV